MIDVSRRSVIDVPKKQKNVHKVIAIISKLTVLSSIAFMIFFIRFTYRSVLGHFDENKLSEIVWMISYLGRDCVLLCVVSAMYFAFNWNEKQYSRICKSCDGCAKALCVWSMDREKEMAINLFAASAHSPSP